MDCLVNILTLRKYCYEFPVHELSVCAFLINLLYLDLIITVFGTEMSQFNAHTDIQIFSLVQSGSTEAFDELYGRYWEKLFNYAFHRTRSKDVAFEMVQDIFVSLWSRREVLQVKNSVSGYLFASVRFQIINYIRSSKQKEYYLMDYIRFTSSSVDNSNEEFVMLHDLQKNLERSIEKLPERCRKITELSMLQNWSSKKISAKLQISQRTVENQLALARKHLKTSLGDYVMLYLIISRLL